MLATMTFFKLYKCAVKFFFQEQLTLVHLQLSSWYQILKWRQIVGQRAEQRLFWFQFVQTSWLFCCWTTSSDSWQRHEEEDMKVNSNILNIIDELWLLPQICPVHQAWHQDEVTHSQRICGLKIKRNKPKVWLFQLSRKKKNINQKLLACEDCWYWKEGPLLDLRRKKLQERRICEDATTSNRFHINTDLKGCQLRNQVPQWDWLEGPVSLTT